MKYQRNALIKQAQEQIAKIEAEIAVEEAKFQKELSAWKQLCLVSAKKYLAAIEAWQSSKDTGCPELKREYAPRRSSRYSSYDRNGGHETPLQKVAQLKQFITQIKMSAEDVIEFKNSYDKKLLDILTQ